MASLSFINIKFRVDLKEFSSQLQNSVRELNKSAQQFQNIGKQLSLSITLPSVAAGAAAIKLASDYQEALNKVDVSFQNSASSVKEFAKTSLETFGIAEGTALDMAATYGDMATSMGFSTAQASKMSTSLVGLAGDLASFKNISIDVANTALASIFTGETESLKKLGIVMTEANLQAYALSQGITKQYKDLSQAEKVQLRYNYVLQMTKNSQGDFARTGGGAANQMRIFQESLKQLGQQFGAVILPLFTKFIKSLNETLKSFTELSPEAKKIIVLVVGIAAAVGPLLIVTAKLIESYAVLKVAIVDLAAKQTILNTVMSVNPYVAIATALTAIGLLYYNTVNSIKEYAKAKSIENTLNKEASSIYVAQKQQIDALVATAKNETLSKSERLKAIKEINKISPEYLGNISLENINTQKTTESLKRYNEALLAGAKAKAAQNLLTKIYEEQIASEVRKNEAKIKANQLSKQNVNDNSLLIAQNKQMQEGVKGLDSIYVKKREREVSFLTDIFNKNKQYLGVIKDIGLSISGNTEEVKKQKKETETINLPKPKLTGDVTGFELPEKPIRNLDFLEKEIERYRALQNELSDVTKEGQEKYKYYADLISDTEIEIKTIKGEGVIKQWLEDLKTNISETKTQLIDITAELNASINQSITDIGVLIGESLGNMLSGQGSLSDMFNGILGLVAGFMKKIGESLIKTSLAMIAFKKIALDPWSGLALGVFLTAFSAVIQSGLPQFANGGIVGGSSFYGDKILARVNSEEMIANTSQQKAIWNAMNTEKSVNVVLGGGFEIDGSKLRLVLDRTDKKNNRLR